MDTKITQLPSKHFLEDGKYKVRYQVQTVFPYHFTDLQVLHEKAIGKVGSVSEDKLTLTWVETTNSRAIKYSQEDLNFIFEYLIYTKIVVDSDLNKSILLSIESNKRIGNEG